MAESLESLLSGRNRAEPLEIAIIKQYVQDKFQAVASVGVSERQITITVKGAALAGALRPLLPELQEKIQTKKRLLIRIK